MLNKYFKIVLSSWSGALALAPHIVLAETAALKKLDEIGVREGPYSAQSETGLSTITGAVVGAVLALVGVIFLALMVYAGYNWMTARGEEEKVEKAKDTITRAFIGLIIVVGAYAIWSFAFNQFILK